jgi:hypothetical protein
LTPQQLDAALSALARASDTFRLSPLERRLYRAAGICATAGILIFIVAFALNFAVSSSVSDAIVFTGIGVGFVGVLLLGVGFKTVLKTLRQRRLLKQLGLSDVSYSVWKAERKRRLFARMSGAILTTLSIGIIGFLLLVFLGSSVGKSEFTPFEIMALILLLLVGVTMLFWRSIQRIREQMDIADNAERLRATLTALQATPENIVVPAAVLERVAGIEHAQIARERARAVLAGVNAADRGYGVLISKEAAEKKAALPGDRRLEVEELIDHLAEPPAADSVSNVVLSAHTSDGLVALDYTVDPGNRRIHVLALHDRNDS